MKVDLPLHPMSKKIILVETSHRKNENGVIHIFSSDMIYHHLGYVLSDKWKNLKKSEELLTDSITFELAPYQGFKVNKNTYQVGLYIYKMHFERLMLFLANHVNKGFTASSGLREFFQMYNITHDDVDESSLYRQWSRYKKKPRNKSNPYFLQKPKLPLRDDQMASIIYHFFREHHDYFFNKKKLDKKLFIQMVAYFDFKNKSLSIRAYSREKKKPWTTIRYQINSFKNFINQMDLSDAVEKSFAIVR